MKLKTKNIGLKRLLRLADFIETLPRKRFNFRTWVGDCWRGSPKFECGTTACALGWATAMPYFRRLGLRMSQGTDAPVLGDNSYHSDITEILFGINYLEHKRLFIPEHSLCGRTTPKQWAKHARKFVARKIADETSS